MPLKIIFGLIFVSRKLKVDSKGVSLWETSVNFLSYNTWEYFCQSRTAHKEQLFTDKGYFFVLVS